MSMQFPSLAAGGSIASARSRRDEAAALQDRGRRESVVPISS